MKQTRLGEERHLEIEIQSGRRTRIPSWMTIPESFNANLRAHPCTSLTALKDLRTLIDEASLSVSDDARPREEAQSGESREATRTFSEGKEASAGAAGADETRSD